MAAITELKRPSVHSPDTQKQESFRVEKSTKDKLHVIRKDSLGREAEAKSAGGFISLMNQGKITQVSAEKTKHPKLQKELTSFVQQSVSRKNFKGKENYALWKESKAIFGTKDSAAGTLAEFDTTQLHNYIEAKAQEIQSGIITEKIQDLQLTFENPD